MGGSPPPKVGRAPSEIEEALLAATVDLITKREQTGRDTTTALVAQVATVGTFLGGFSLLGDSAKAALVQSDASQNALVAAAISLGFSLSTYFLLPSRIPNANNITRIRTFWNGRVLVRKLLLLAAFIALGFAVFYAIEAYDDARGAVEAKPAASITGKLSVPAEGSPSVEVTSTWDGLAPGAASLTCVTETTQDGSGSVTGAGTGFADRTGALTETLSLPVVAAAKTVELSTFELMTDDDDGDAMSLCASLVEQERVPDASVVLMLSR